MTRYSIKFDVVAKLCVFYWKDLPSLDFSISLLRDSSSAILVISFTSSILLSCFGAYDILLEKKDKDNKDMIMDTMHNMYSPHHYESFSTCILEL